MNKILITGASRGIGLALTKAFLENDDWVIATHRSAEISEPLMQLKDTFSQSLEFLKLDVTAAEGRQSILNKAQEMTHHLDVLINNAGILQPSQRLADVNEADFMNSFAVNSVAPILISKILLPLLEAATNPRIVNITMPTSPISALERTEQHHYIASRYALNCLTKMTAVELGEKGIITIALYPGYIKTDMNDFAEQAASAEEAIPPLVQLINNLTMENNGRCLLPNGNEYSW